MTRDRYFLVGVSALIITAFLWGAYWYKSSEAKRIEALTMQSREQLVRPYSPSLGPADAKVTIVEFLDPECEACAGFYPSVKKVMAEFKDNVRLVIRYMPFHPNSPYAVGILEGARKQGKYWEALETLFLRQPEWASHHAPKPELLMGYMKDLGLDVDRIKATTQDAEQQSRLQQDQQDGTVLGVTRTPSFFVNGKPVQNLGYEELRSAVETSLKNP